MTGMGLKRKPKIIVSKTDSSEQQKSKEQFAHLKKRMSRFSVPAMHMTRPPKTSAQNAEPIKLSVLAAQGFSILRFLGMASLMYDFVNWKCSLHQLI